MRTSLRVIEESEAIPKSADAADRLTRALTEIGVSILSSVSSHSRGGYSVVVDIPKADFDGVASKLAADGFRFVI